MEVLESVVIDGFTVSNGWLDSFRGIFHTDTKGSRNITAHKCKSTICTVYERHIP